MNIAAIQGADVQKPDSLPVDLGQWLILGIVFIVVAGNAIIPIWSGLIPTILLIPLVILMRHGGSLGSVLIDRAALPWLLAVGIMATIGLISLLVNGGPAHNWATWLSSYVSPIVLYLGVRQYCEDLRFVRLVVAVVLLASMLPLTFGLVQYYREWGVPTGVELLMSRYFIERMETYMAATFGNTGNTAAYLALVLPIAMSTCLTRFSGRALRWLAFFAAMIALLNAVIVQSRTLLWILLLGVPGILWFYRVRLVGFTVVIALAIGLFVLPFLQALDELLAISTSVFGGTEADDSVSERVEAMHFALRTLFDSPALGVGPGNTMLVNPHTSAHQFWLQQGSELGLLGLLASFAMSAAILLRALIIWWHRAGRETNDLAFMCFSGAALYVLYGVIANMTLALTFVNAWIGLLAVLVALGEACNSIGKGGLRAPASSVENNGNGV
jgi:O-antigen ligase